MLMSFGLDCCCDWFSIVCRARFGHHGESESSGSVPDAVSPAPETKPQMSMWDVTEHERETERARRGLLSTLHVDIETSCRMGGLHIGGSTRVSFDGTLSNERQARKVQGLRNEAGAGGLAVQVELGDLEPRLRSWMARPSVPDVMKERQASRKRDWRVPGATGQGRLIRAPKQRSWTTEPGNVGLVDSGDTERLSRRHSVTTETG